MAPSVFSRYIWAFIPLLLSPINAADTAFNWDAIEPSWDLRYTPCYDSFECARILMPLDWLNEKSDNRTVALAVLKVPATVGPEDATFGGTLMVNPGGPGDSGIVHMLKNGRYIQSMIDANKHYEVLSFDPRGMAFTTPHAKCYSNQEARDAARWQSRGAGLLDISDKQMTQRLVLSQARGYQCSLYQDEGVDFNIHEFTSTASVARDVLRLVDETEVLLQKQLKEIRGNAYGDSAQKSLLQEGDLASSPPRLQYYGTSYGTVLGNFILSMFPGRVSRMFLDGLVVGESWIKFVSFHQSMTSRLSLYMLTCELHHLGLGR